MTESYCFCGKPKNHPVGLNSMGLPECNYFALETEEHVFDTPGGDAGASVDAVASDILELSEADIQKAMTALEIGGTANSTLDADISTPSLQPIGKTIHGSKCGASCPTCMLVTEVKMGLQRDVMGGQPPKKKSSHKRKEDHQDRRMITPRWSTQEFLDSLESPAAAVNSLATKIFSVLKQTIPDGKITIDNIYKVYLGQSVRLSEENRIKMVNMIVRMFKDQKTGEKWIHPLSTIKSLGKSSSVLASELHNLDVLANDSGYHALSELSLFQSSEFLDMSDLQNGNMTYGDPLNCVHPILVALFGIKLAGLEDTAIQGDSYSLMKQLFHGGPVDEAHMALLNSRFSDTLEDRVYMTHTSDEISAEIQRALLHMNLRRLAVKIRTGDFQKAGTIKTSDWFNRMKSDGVQIIKSKEEKFLEMCLKVLGHKSFIGKKSTGELGSATHLVLPLAGPQDMSTDNIGITQDFLQSVDYNVFKKRFEIQSGPKFTIPSSAGMKYHDMGLYGPQPNNGLGLMGGYDRQQPFFQPHSIYPMPPAPRMSLTGTGTIVVFVERQKVSRGLESTCFSYGNSFHGIPFVYDKQIVTSYGATYSLKSAVCYRPRDFSGFGQEVAENAPLFTVVFTAAGPWLYDPHDSLTRTGRTNLIKRALESMWRNDVVDGKTANNDFDTWEALPQVAPLIEKKKADITTGKRTFDDNLITEEEAHDLVAGYACVMVYSQEPDVYRHNVVNPNGVVMKAPGCCLLH